MLSGPVVRADPGGPSTPPITLDRQVESAPEPAERVRRLLEKAGIAALVYGRLHLLAKPWLSKYPVSALRDWFWKDAVIEPH